MIKQSKKIPAGFKDYFSEASADYLSHRPHYPDKLFQYLSQISTSTNHVWDCATGSGQAAHSLNKYFAWVTATDASQNQIANAKAEDGIIFKQAYAENSGLSDHSMDLICVAQALHWFNFDDFFAEVDRVLKPAGILAVWSYELLAIESDIDTVIEEFYNAVLDGYWSPERLHIENNYQHLNFPYPQIETPPFEMKTEWNLSNLIGYFSTWSAVKNYIRTNSQNPLVALEEQLAPLWGDPESKKIIIWPLNLIVSKKG